MIPLRRRPRWKRVLLYPLSLYRHYVILHRRHSRKESCILAWHLCKSLLRKD